MAPALIEAVKVSGLVLVADASTLRSLMEDSMDEGDCDAIVKGVDGVLQSNGVLMFNQTIDM